MHTEEGHGVAIIVAVRYWHVSEGRGRSARYE